jgi:DNA-binding transcriptional LysR family regulator
VVERSDLLTVLPRHFVRVADTASELVIRELPFHMPTVHIDSLWHQRNTQQAAHRWLRSQVQSAAAKVFSKPS